MPDITNELNFKKFLIEMPITKFEKLGDWSPNAKKYGYNLQDIGVLTNQKAIDKIHRRWSNTEQNFDLYFLRSASGYKQREIGAVTPEFVKEKFGLDIQPNQDSITVIFTNNIGAEKINFNSWMIAHRLGHAIRREPLFQQYAEREILGKLRELAKEFNYFGPTTKSRNFLGYNQDIQSQNKIQTLLLPIAYSLGTMKSAKQRNLFSEYEFIYELFAQYINTGKITFKPLEKQIIVRNRMAWGRPNPDKAWLNVSDEDLQDINYGIENFANGCEYYFKEILDSLIGKMFVM